MPPAERESQRKTSSSAWISRSSWSISDIRSNLVIDDLGKLITRVIDSIVPHETEIQDTRGHWYVIRVRPYVTLDNTIDGASIVLLDTDSIKQHLEERKN